MKVTTFNSKYAINPLQSFALLALDQASPSSTVPINLNNPYGRILTRSLAAKPRVTTGLLHDHLRLSSSSQRVPPTSSVSYQSTLKHCGNVHQRATRRHPNSIAQEAKRKERIVQASKIVTVDNSPVNPRQYALLRMIYDNITRRPMQHWAVLIAIVIHRTPGQVIHWFANQRQADSRKGLPIPQEVDINKKTHLLQPIFKLCPEDAWSDSFFEGIIRVCYFYIIYNHKVFERQ